MSEIKIGDKVRTADPLTWDGLRAYSARRAGASGVVTAIDPDPDGMQWVRHDDGSTAPYDACEVTHFDASLPTVMPPPDPLPPGGTFDATFHRVQDGYPDGWPRAVFVDSDGEPVGVRCGPHEAAAIEAGAKALLEVAALRAGVAKFVEGAKVNATDGQRCLLSTNHADHDALAGLVKS